MPSTKSVKVSIEKKVRKPKFNKHALYKNLLDLLYNFKSSHIGSCLSCFDILIQTFIFEMSKDDKFLLSKGHAAPALYVVLNYLGIISEKDFKTFLQDATKLPAHTPNYFFKDIIPFPTGSLGHGLSLTAGMAHSQIIMAGKKKKIPNVYCLMSDGECNEGQVWEAAQYASSFKLSNLFVLLDKNGLQAFGETKNVLGDTATRERWASFGFEVFEGNGHDPKDLSGMFIRAKKSKSTKPKILIFNTVKGYGISSFENKLSSHYTLLSEKDYQDALERIKVYEA